MTFNGKDVTNLRTAADFRLYYQDIPDEAWNMKTFFRAIEEGGRIKDDTSCRCAMGWLMPVERSSGVRAIRSEHADYLNELFKTFLNIHWVPLVNDGLDEQFKQATPKARMLAALDHIVSLGG